MIATQYLTADPADMNLTSLEFFCGLDPEIMFRECAFWACSPLDLFINEKMVDETTTKELIVSIGQVQAQITDYNCDVVDQGVCNTVQIPLSMEEVVLAKKTTGFYYDPECTACKLLIKELGANGFAEKVEADFMKSFQLAIDTEVIAYMLSQVDAANQLNSVASLEALGMCGCIDAISIVDFMEVIKSQFIHKNISSIVDIVASPDVSLLLPSAYRNAQMDSLSQLKNGAGEVAVCDGQEVRYLIGGGTWTTSSLLPAKTMVVMSRGTKPVHFVHTGMRKKQSDHPCSFGLSNIYVKDYGYIVPVCEQTRYFVVSGDAFCAPCVTVAPSC
jgi:hypothetical protein